MYQGTAHSVCDWNCFVEFPKRLLGEVGKVRRVNTAPNFLSTGFRLSAVKNDIGNDGTRLTKFRLFNPRESENLRNDIAVATQFLAGCRGGEWTKDYLVSLCMTSRLPLSRS